jgi:RES domain
VSRAPVQVTLPAGSRLVRIVGHAHGTSGALFFGPPPGEPPTGRFDAPDGAFRVCYLAQTTAGAFAETILRLAPAPLVPGGARAVAVREMQKRAWAWTATRRDLTLVDLSSGPGLSALDVTAAVTAGEAHHRARELSAALYASEPPVDGMRYRPRHAPDELAVALFDRAGHALLPVEVLTPLLSDGERIGRLLRDYQIALLPD